MYRRTKNSLASVCPCPGRKALHEGMNCLKKQQKKTLE